MTDAKALRDAVARVETEVATCVIGQDKALRMVMVAFCAGGHVLLEGAPGLGKTLLAKAFSAALGIQQQRIQFTPDLMPSDITGVNVFDPSSGAFRLQKGPIFTDLLLADEINRTPPKTQSALLEAMQERQTTIDGESHELSRLFFVLATQNPIEFEGTYRLPEAQADRFLLRIRIDYPAPEDELELFARSLERRMSDLREIALPEGVFADREQVAGLRKVSSSVHVAQEVLEYLSQLVQALRRHRELDLAVSPRGALALLESARALAWLSGRDYVVPDDLKQLAEPCWGHRLLLSPDAELEGGTVSSVLEEVSRTVPVPRKSRDEAGR